MELRPYLTVRYTPFQEIAMKSPVAAAVFAAISTVCPPAAFADHDHHHGGALGAVSFPVSCTPEAQKRFNTLVSLLHSFHWERVDKAVADVLDADPTCAMAHWGKALRSLDNSLG